MNFNYFSPFAALGLVAAALPALGADLDILVTSLASDNGDVHVAVYDRPDAFPDSDGMVAEQQVAISGGVAHARFEGLKPGLYAVAVYHDENANDEFDQGLFRIPLEDYAFSNGARVVLAPPTFDAAAFPLPREGATITIDID